jgi:hypothetical protein
LPCIKNQEEKGTSKRKEKKPAHRLTAIFFPLCKDEGDQMTWMSKEFGHTFGSDRTEKKKKKLK